MSGRAGARCALGLALAASFIATGARADEPWVRLGAHGVEVVEGAGRDTVVLGTVALAGPLLDLVQRGDRAWIARGDGGVTVVEIDDPAHPRAGRTFDFDGDAVAVALDGTHLVVRLDDGSENGIAITRPGEMPRARASARVAAVGRGWVALENLEPVAPRARFALRRPSPADSPADTGPFDGVVEVERTSGTLAFAPLPRGTRAAVGDEAVATTTPSRDRLYAPRGWRGYTRVRALLRPAVTVDTIGFAMLTDLAVDHHFRAPFRLGVLFAPLAVGVQRNPNDPTGQLLHVAGLDTLLAVAAWSGDHAEVGVGVGAVLHTRDRDAAALAAVLRGGSLDGAHVSATISLEMPVGGGARFGGLLGEINLPLSRRFTLSAGVGGGMGFAYGSLNLKSWLRGSGGPGTVILTTGLGVDWFHEGQSGFGFGWSGLGPAFNLGVESRG